MSMRRTKKSSFLASSIQLCVSSSLNPFAVDVVVVDVVVEFVPSSSHKLPLALLVLHVPLVRSFAYMRQGKNVCVLNKIKSPEREQKHLYSLPLSFFQTQRFYQLASLPPIEKEFLDEKGRILSISRVIKAFPDSFIVLPEEYSFGERIDDDLKQVNREQILRIANNIYYSRFMEMFSKGKSDFALIFPATLYRSFGENTPLKVRSYSIADNPDYVSGHVICPNTPQGTEHIKRINAAIKRIYLTPAFINAHTRYLPAQDKQNLRTIIEQSIEKLMLAN